MKAITANTSEIIPSQDYVKPNTIRAILENWLHNDKKGLLPNPLVRKSPEGNLIAIDGHNLLVIQDLFEGEAEVFLANGPKDTLDEKITPGSSQESIDDRNRELSEKFEESLKISRSLQSDGISSITDLRKSISYLENTEKAKEFLRQETEVVEKIR